MRVALFVPCYVDQLRPSVGMATAELLEARGIEVDFPTDQTCCGQPLVSAGAREQAIALARHHLDVFAGADAVVCPSGSCVATVRRRYRELLGETPEVIDLAARTFEICEFLIQQAQGAAVTGRFPYRVGLHGSCHALRELRLGAATERMQPPSPDPARSLLARLEGLTFADLVRTDECCGFGGFFSVDEPDVSALAGLDRLEDHRAGGAEVIASTDVSCLVHLEGLARRQDLPIRLLHVVEVLAEAGQGGA